YQINSFSLFGSGSNTVYLPFIDATMMYYYKAFGLTFSSEVFLPECIQIAQPSTIDLSIVHKVIDTPELQLTTIHRRGVYAQSGRGKEITKELYLHWEGIATYKAIEGTTLEVQAFT